MDRLAVTVEAERLHSCKVGRGEWVGGCTGQGSGEAELEGKAMVG